MSEEQQVKDAVQEAQKNLEQEKQLALRERVKKIVEFSLKRIEEEEKIIKEHQDKLSILKKDLKDLENGRLDLIEERQQKDPISKEISVIIVKKVEEKNPYEIRWSQPWYQPYHVVANEIFDDFSNATEFFSDTWVGNKISGFIPGAYQLDSGNVVDIRPRF